MASCRDCPCDSASCRDSRQEAKSHGQSLQEATGSKRSRTVSAEAKYDEQSLQEAKISGLIYTLCSVEKLLSEVCFLILLLIQAFSENTTGGYHMHSNYVMSVGDAISLIMSSYG